MSHHPVDIYVGKRLRLRRVMLGMSQEAIGSAIGVTFQQIQKYERGINRMGASRLYDFSRVLGVNVSYFFEGMDDPVASKQIGLSDTPQAVFEEDRITSRETLEMIRSYYKIQPEAVRKSVLELIRSIAEGKTFPDSDITK